MPNEILDKQGSFSALTITLASLADGSGRQATQVTDTSPSVEWARVFAKVTTGTSPTADSAIEFYISRADDDGTELSSGSTGASDAAYSNTKSELEFVNAVKVSGTSDTTYVCEFLVYKPGSDWRLVVFNETGSSLNATGSNHEIGYRTVTDEVQ